MKHKIIAQFGSLEQEWWNFETMYHGHQKQLNQVLGCSSASVDTKLESALELNKFFHRSVDNDLRTKYPKMFALIHKKIEEYNVSKGLKPKQGIFYEITEADKKKIKSEKIRIQIDKLQREEPKYAKSLAIIFGLYNTGHNREELKESAINKVLQHTEDNPNYIELTGRLISI